MKKHPIIGITLDYEETPTYSKKPWYALRENYCASISALGAVPLPLPHEVELVEQYLELIDGLMITGGAFDVSPALYGESSQHETVVLKQRRTQFEWAITQGCIERKKPILGICGGEQLLNVILGGTLIQHIPDSIPNALAHEQPNPRDEAGHAVKITPDTLLYSILSTLSPWERGGESQGEGIPHSPISPLPSPPPQAGEGIIVQVNSAHHQAIATPAPNTIINALAPDGVIEGIELPSHPFCLGVQWHPEYHVSGADSKIFEAFVDASRK